MIFKNFGHIIEFDIGSSINYPRYKGKGMQTNDSKMWMKLDNKEWKRCNLLSQLKIQKQLLICQNEEELLMLLDYLEEKL